MKRSGWFASFVVLPAVVAGGPLASLAGAGAPPPTCEPAWTPLFGGAAGVDQQIHDFAIFDDGQGGGPALFAGGQFTLAGGISAKGIAKWNGTGWSALGSGVSYGGFDGTVVALEVFDDGSGPALYAGGVFTDAGGVEAWSIAKWDGQTWSALGSGVQQEEVLPGGVFALAAFDDGSGPALYAGGAFDAAGGVPAKSLAKWDGARWSALPIAFDDKFPSVSAMAVHDDGLGGGPALYVGGSFTGVGGVSTGSLARWNGTNWSALGIGIGAGGEVYALAVVDLGGGPALYVGGFFSVPGFGLSKNVARWNGLAWSALGSGTGSAVYALSGHDDGLGGGTVLCAGGFFTTAGGQSANRVARWNGAAWSAFGTGVGSTGQSVSALASFTDVPERAPSLFAGGQFTSAGGKDANHIARWGCPTTPACVPADLNCDGAVDGSDLGLLLGAWGACPKAGACDSDLNDDGFVDGGDLGILLVAW